MPRLYQISVALYRVVRLRFKDPRVSRCMLASLLIAVVTAGPMARVQSSVLQTQSVVCHRMTLGIIKQLNSRLGMLSRAGVEGKR
jgi:hypothetical protein